MVTKRRSATMQDVADLVGVSKQTVSAVLNEKPGISSETRDQVIVAVQQLGYHRDMIARSLRTGRTGSIALIVSDTSSPFIGRLAVTAEDRARAAGYSLTLFNTHDDIDRETAYFGAAVERAVEGVLFISATDAFTGQEILQSAGIPYVAVDRVPDPYDGSAVVFDNLQTGRLAAEHLIGLGHTCIAHISGPYWVRMSRDRLDGFEQVLEESGVGHLCEVEKADGWDYRAGYEAMKRIAARPNRPTAVFAAGDALAIGAIRAARDFGLEVPSDVSVVGVDDIDCAVYLAPPLTTVRQSIDELAELGLQMLFGIIQGEEHPDAKLVLEPTLVVRGSTAPPRHAATSSDTQTAWATRPNLSTT